jgi:hypothetical protein
MPRFFPLFVCLFAVDDEENRFVFSAEMHIKAIECASATWEEVQERATFVKTCGKTQAHPEIGEERLAPVLRQGAPLIAADDQ